MTPEVKSLNAFAERLNAAAALTDARLAELIEGQGGAGTPSRLLAAMRHAALGGGKRLRPFLVFESAALFAVAPEKARDAAAAIECVHCYSLVHDDLPCMDNDDTRRGQPTVWRAYDEWTAVLVGDALQTLAFEILAAPACHPDAGIRSDLVIILAKAAGAPGMVGGQALDLEAERLKPHWTGDSREISRLHDMKTGRLITAAAEMGGVLGGANAAERKALRDFGTALGLAFQLSDDLIDAEASAEVAGKATGKDAAAGKATIVSALGISGARRKLDDVVDSAILALAPFGDKADILGHAARFMIGRQT